MSSSGFSDLFPIPDFSDGFTTCPDIKDSRISVVALSDRSLNVHKVFSKTEHRLVTPPTSVNAPDKAWEAFYPVGSINPSGSIPGGFGFYLSGAAEFSDKLAQAQEALMSYRIMLDSNFDYVKGGKLPGIFGGVGDSAYGCTGGRQNGRSTCFNVRLMWRAKGQGELYIYAPLTDNNKRQFLDVPPKSSTNNDYGFSVGRGAFTLESAKGRWTTVALRIKLNDMGAENGEIQLWIDGTSVIKIVGLTLRQYAETTIQGMHCQTFFGGHSEDWASSKDQCAWFADMSGAIIV